MLKYLNCPKPFTSCLQNGWEDDFATCHSKAEKGSGAKVIPQLDLYTHPPASQMLRKGEKEQEEKVCGKLLWTTENIERAIKQKSHKAVPYLYIFPSWKNTCFDLYPNH